jgi:hypothetical protein
MVILPHRRKAFRTESGSSGDPYWSSVILLLHANSFPILDSADAAVTITAGTDPAVYNTTAPKFGAGNLDFNANNRFINTAIDAKFTMGTSNWTWEGWIKGPVRSATSRNIFASNFLSMRCNIGGTTVLVSYSFNGSTFTALSNPTIGSGVWTFLSISRTVVGSNSIFRVFVDGVQVGSDVTVAATNMTGSGALNFGGASGNQNTSLGALDECRISKVVRDGSVVPTAPFPDGLSTSYSNAGGSGDRTATIPVSKSAGADIRGPLSRFVGVGASNTYFENVPNGEWLKFDFGAAKIINELKYYQQLAVSQGTWQLEGSNDDSTWTAVGTPFEITGTIFVSGSAFSSNTNSYRYYRIKKTAGTVNRSPWAYQFEFKISL